MGLRIELIGQVLRKGMMHDVYSSLAGAEVFDGIRWTLLVGEARLARFIKTSDAIVMWKKSVAAAQGSA